MKEHLLLPLLETSGLIIGVSSMLIICWVAIHLDNNDRK